MSCSSLGFRVQSVASSTRFSSNGFRLRLAKPIACTSFFAVVLADARPATLLARPSYAVMLADARPAALLAPASLAVVLAEARPAAFLAPVSLAVVLADA